MDHSSARIAIILFGGTGTRFSPDMPKQFESLNDKPLCYYAVKACENSQCVDKILIVAHKDYLAKTQEVLSPFGFTKVLAYAPGGESRQESVYAALSYLEGNGLIDSKDLILIQDGDRPGISEEIIKENFLVAEKLGGAVTAFPSTDSVFLSPNGEKVDSYLDRKLVYRAETPQTFVFGEYLRAARKAHAEKKSFTDDASCFLTYGGEVGIVLSNGHNQKITRKEDMLLFQRGRHE